MNDAEKLLSAPAQESDTSQEKVDSKESQENADKERRIRHNARNLAESANVFANVMRERNRNDLSPLMEDGAVSLVRTSAVNLYEFSEGKTKADSRGIADMLNRMNYGLKEIGSASRGGRVREDVDNLNKLAYATKSVYENADDFSKTFVDDLEVYNSAEKVKKSAEDAYYFITKLRDTLRR